MTYVAINPIQHGLEDGSAVTLQPGDELTEDFTESDIAQLLEAGAIEEAEQAESDEDSDADEQVQTTTPEGENIAAQEDNKPVELPEDLDKHEGE